MSRYVLELNSDIIKSIVAFGMMGETGVSTVFKIDELEELNSDYINEHYGDLQDTAYQKGFEDGKAQSERGCEGCKYERENKTKVPCILCSNNFKLPCVLCSSKFKNQWTAKDDKIVVGDEVAFHHDDGRPDIVVVVTYIGQDGFIDGMDGRGAQYAHKNPTKWTKTGRHFDIQSILEAMKT